MNTFWFNVRPFLESPHFGAYSISSDFREQKTDIFLASRHKKKLRCSGPRGNFGSHHAYTLWLAPDRNLAYGWTYWFRKCIFCPPSTKPGEIPYSFLYREMVSTTAGKNFRLIWATSFDGRAAHVTASIVTTHCSSHNVTNTFLVLDRRFNDP